MRFASFLLVLVRKEIEGPFTGGGCPLDSLRDGKKVAMGGYERGKGLTLFLTLKKI